MLARIKSTYSVVVIIKVLHPNQRRQTKSIDGDCLLERDVGEGLVMVHWIHRSNFLIDISSRKILPRHLRLEI